MDIETIVSVIEKYNTPHVTVTGGEPLAQKNCIDLLKRLCDLDYDVSLETSGAITVADVDPRVTKVLDVKTPASAEVEKNRFDNFTLLNPADQLKFVICDRADYLWSKQLVQLHQLENKAEILFSACQGQLQASDLAGWILQDRLNVRLQIQLHKYLWGDKTGV